MTDERKWELYKTLDRGYSGQPWEAVRECLAHIAQLEAQLNETHTDESGTVWTRPTAWAYWQVCQAREAGKRLAAGARKDANKLAANNAQLREGLVWIGKRICRFEAARGNKCEDLGEFGRHYWCSSCIARKAIAETPEASLEAIRAEEHPDTKRLDFIEKHHVEMHCFGGPDLYHEGIVHPFEWEVGKNPEFGWGPRMPSIREAIDGYEAIRARGDGGEKA